MIQLWNFISAIPSSLWISLLSIVLAYIWGTSPYRKLKSLGIYGPAPTAFLGNIPELKKKGIRKMDLELLEKYGRVVSFYTGRYPGIIVADPEMLKQIMIDDFATFTNRSSIVTSDEMYTNSVLGARDDLWKTLRKIISSNFTPRRIQGMASLIHSAILNLEKNCEAKAESGEDADISRLFGCHTMDIVASTLFGIDIDSQNNPDNPFVKSAHQIINADRNRSIFLLAIICQPLFKLMTRSTILLDLLISSRKFLLKFCWLLLADRKEKEDKKGTFLLQMMINTQQSASDSEEKNGIGGTRQENNTKQKNTSSQRKMTDQEIVAQCYIFFLAGYETTASTLSFLAHSLALNPYIQNKVHHEIKEVLGDEVPNYDNIQELHYLDQCVSETLRKYPITLRVCREASEDIMIKNVFFPKHTDVIIPIYALHHDATFWQDPLKFDPNRFTPEAKKKHIPFTYLPFGGGPRNCIGIRLAQLELKMTMVQILRKFKFVPCEKTEDPIEFGPSPAALLTVKNGITLKIEKL